MTTGSLSTAHLTGLTTALAGRYRLERELGAGGMATVWLAEDLRHERRVAIKVLHPELSAVLGPERFLSEIRTTASLQHPHILPLFDSGAAEGLLYYVMPFVAGETLRSRLERERQLPVRDAVRIAREIADALDYAHRHGVIHRDVKPENILLHDDHVVVADFGIALAVQQAGGQRMTQTGLSLGTPQYMAPEQAMGERTVDARADVYALGAVLYEMLAGEPPFTGPTAQAIVARVMTESPRALAGQRSSVPPALDDVVRTALEKLPADRFVSAEQFARALEGAADGRDTGGGARRGRAVSDRVARIATAAAALAVGISAGWLARRPPTTPRPAMRFQISADSVEVASECCGFQIAVGPDERRIFFVGASRGRSRLYVRDVDDLAARPVAGSEGAVEVAVSSDGQWLAFRVPATDGAATGGDFELRKVPAVGGTPLLVARTTGFPYGMTWTDDDVIVYASQRAPLHRVAAAGGLPVPIAHTDSAISPRFVRGGVVLYSTVRFGPGRVRRLSLADGEVRDLTEGSGAASVAGYLVIERGGSLVAQRYDARTGGLAGPPTAIAGDIARATDFSVSEQGMLAFGSGSTGGVLASVDRRGLVALLPIRVEGASHFDNPNYSPDGRFLAVAAGHSPGHELFVIDIARGTSLRMTFSGGTEFADWTPDGRALVYQKDDTLLAMQPADRSAPESILLSTGKRRIFRISVAGGWIAYAVAPFDSPHGSDIHLLPLGADRSADRVYQATPYGELAPALSPDGRWMAYVSDESGRDEVYLSSVPVAAAREPISTAGGREPVWDRDGRTLYYRTPTGDLVAVTLGAGARPTVVARTILPHTDAELSSDGADFAAQPRGGGFLMMRSRTSDLRIVVETDALARLRDRRR